MILGKIFIAFVIFLVLSWYSIFFLFLTWVENGFSSMFSNLALYRFLYMKAGQLITSFLSGYKLLIILLCASLSLDFVITSLMFTPLNNRMALYKVCKNIDSIDEENTAFGEEAYLIVLIVNFIECICYCFCYLEER